MIKQPIPLPKQK